MLKCDGTKVPHHCWKKRLDEPIPATNVHTFSRPPIMESLGLLPIAYRVHSYLANQRACGKEPTFDFRGITLDPPNPGPYAGVPLGGIGGGSIGRGYRGDFRRWSLYPGRYSHRIVQPDQFSLRIKRGASLYSQVLSTLDNNENEALNGWNWSLPKDSSTYYALFPRCWSVIENPVPNMRVIIKQISPVLPNNYTESCLPVAVFEIEVENTGEDAEVSVMFTFQNGDGGEQDVKGNFIHLPFTSFHPSTESSQENASLEKRQVNVKGVIMSHHHSTTISSGKATKSCLSSFFTNCTSTTPPPPPPPPWSAATPCTSRDDQGSFAIAAESEDGITACPLFVVGGPLKDGAISAQRLWECFTEHGHLAHLSQPNQTPSDSPIAADELEEESVYNCSQVENAVAAAVCINHKISQSDRHTFSFSLAWDVPIARFGSGEGVRRHHTRYFGRSGLSAHAIAAYALVHRSRWERDIIQWQSPVTENTALPTFYRSQLFNELYYIVDGGTIWTDGGPISEEVSPPPVLSPICHGEDDSPERGGREEREESGARKLPTALSDKRTYPHPDTTTEATANSNPASTAKYNVQYGRSNSGSGGGGGGVTLSEMKSALSRFHRDAHSLSTIMNEENLCLNSFLTTPALSADTLQRLEETVGRFLYLEGHEYLMYNTYDVHHYAGFALLRLWPLLELSLQRDFSAAIATEDGELRVMLGCGDWRPRKVSGAVPHDLGTPSESPWVHINSYVFQDVSRWKDLGPKFALQIYRDVVHTGSLGLLFLTSVYASVLQAMEYTLTFDRDGDGMIENEGFPDQTYDIWTATGIHAYSGGLWVVACYATAAMAKSIAKKAKAIYNDTLWNGRYFNYDSSASPHHDSIMADMLAGQLYSHACGLPALTTASRALSSFTEIYRENVIRFGGGRLIGAVNGMRPGDAGDGDISPLSPTSTTSATSLQKNDNKRTAAAAASSASPSCRLATVDVSCMQSREVWTGTTYSLAASMIFEATTAAATADTTTSLEPPILSLGITTTGNTSGSTSGNESSALDIISPDSVTQLIDPVTETGTGTGSAVMEGTEKGTGTGRSLPFESRYSESLSRSDCQQLLRMGMDTARGIHEGGWQSFGYQFATPEAWESSGRYRSLGYMRPLAIWSMQFAIDTAGWQKLVVPEDGDEEEVGNTTQGRK